MAVTKKKAASPKAANSPSLRGIMLVHWKDTELPERVAALKPHAKQIHTLSQAQATGMMRSVREAGVDAVIIDLSRLPAHGAELARAIRQSPATRALPLLFVGGAADKIERVRAQLPDATYGDWATVASDLARAKKNVPSTPVRPPSGATVYAGRTLSQKLGVKPGVMVALVDAPDTVAATLAMQVPEAIFRRDARGAADLALWFVRDLAELRRGLPRWSAREDVAALWICWPKKASGVQTDLGEEMVRTRGIAAGLIDYKVCAIDATWSGHKFAWRGRAKK